MFYIVRTTKRVNDVGNVTLVAQYLLSSHSYGHCLFRRRSIGFVERVSVQRLSTSQGCRQGIDGCLNIGDTVGQGEANFLSRGGTGFSYMVSTDADGIPARDLPGTISKYVSG